MHMHLGLPSHTAGCAPSHTNSQLVLLHLQRECGLYAALLQTHVRQVQPFVVLL